MDKGETGGRARRLASDIGSFLKSTWFLVCHNWREVLAFILACSAFSIVATWLLTSATGELLMRIAGTTYIAPVNLSDILLNPLCVLVLVAEQVIATLIALFQIAGLLHAYSMAQIGLDTNLASMVAAGLRACRKTLHPKNWPIVPFVLVLLPLTKLMSLSSTTYKLVVPGFVNQTIEYTALFSVLYNVFYVMLLAFALVYIFSVNLYVLRDDSFAKSCAQSRKLGKGKYLNTVLSLGALVIVVNVVVNVVAAAVAVNAAEFMALLGGGSGVVTRAGEVGQYTYALRTVLQGFVLPAFNVAGLTVLFYHYLEEREPLTTLSRQTFRTRRLSRRASAVSVGAVALVVVGAAVLMTTNYSFLADPVDRPLVCAHRGDNVNAPENTMPAFELAFSENLWWIELDCHQTSDGVIVVSHDDNIKRVTGHNLKISDHTFAELECYEMGDWMPGVYEHVHVPTLEQVLLSAREHGVNVQVELKGSSGDVDFEEHVLGVIDSCGMHDHVMVICQDAKRMMRVAELDPTITKGYCMFVALGQVEDIPYTDNVTIEETNVTPELVHRLHEKGILVFCWTVDLEDTVQYLVSCDVDVIGTDNPLLVSAALDHADYSGGFPRALNVFLHTIASMAR